MTRLVAKALGILALLVNAVLWHHQGDRASNSPGAAFPFFLLAALALPALAGWRSSKLWLLLLTSPVALVAVAISRMC